MPQHPGTAVIMPDMAAVQHFAAFIFKWLRRQAAKMDQRSKGGVEARGPPVPHHRYNFHASRQWPSVFSRCLDFKTARCPGR
jgi:hypothetical protein